ncbi:MAG: imidazole glycerol phosphate synthase subunit HisH [Desulfovibrionaceae bacterium]|nr:imidazole glycerol phosphate synthase subunit HisH [Desulfovibrionaceae bacterium]
MLAILEYKAGNQTSVRRALNALDIPGAVTADPVLIRQAKGLIFPGVGAAGQAMRNLRESGMDRVLRETVAARKPLLGICLGCQILLDSSDENTTRTLGLVSGRCRRFEPELREQSGRPIRIPHMGWNSLRRKRPSPLLQGIPQDARFYFVHSYYVECPPELTIATSIYGREFCTLYGRDGLWACQFHPEKSGMPGLRLLKNFYAYCTENPHAE